MIPKIQSRIRPRGGGWAVPIEKALIDTEVLRLGETYFWIPIPLNPTESEIAEINNLVRRLAKISVPKSGSALGYKHNLVSVWSLPSVRLVGSPRTQMFNKAFNSKVVS